MSTHNICFYGEMTKIILQLSSNTHLICSTDTKSIYDGDVAKKRENLMQIPQVCFSSTDRS